MNKKHEDRTELLAELCSVLITAGRFTTEQGTSMGVKRAMLNLRDLRREGLVSRDLWLKFYKVFGYRLDPEDISDDSMDEVEI